MKKKPSDSYIVTWEFEGMNRGTVSDEVVAPPDYGYYSDKPVERINYAGQDYKGIPYMNPKDMSLRPEPLKMKFFPVGGVSDV